ncbi:MAG: hypothetical protein WBC80_20695, partial [Isosphaeraceae bacterium]
EVRCFQESTSIDIQFIGVGFLRKMERHGGKHGTVDIMKGLVGICFLSILHVLLLDAPGDAKEQFEILHSIMCRYPFPAGHRLNQQSLFSHRSLERAPWTIN